MACHYCQHYLRDTANPPFNDSDIVGGARNETGRCTLSPTWQQVTGLHFCSQLRLKHAEDLGRFWVGMHESAKAFHAERARRSDLEKTVKVLREKLRQLRKAAPK